jgi:hypothetical protein
VLALPLNGNNKLSYTSMDIFPFSWRGLVGTPEIKDEFD